MTQALTYVEIDVPYCTLVYGVAPCAASIPGTGERKCFNTLATCQDRPNFAEETVTLRFGIPSAFLPPEIECIPNIEQVDFRPAAISLGENLGQRASVTVTFGDHPHSDTGPAGDKYLADRSYDPFNQGTYWGKFRARQPFLRGRALRMITGRVGQDEMETRHYILESFDGPTIDGKFKLIAKDVLKLADGDRAQAPRLSNGFLVADITDVDTAATLSPAGIGDTEYPASGEVAIGGKEICSFTRSGDALTLTRAQLGTEAQAHSAQDRVQLVLRYVSQDPADIIHDLLTGYSGVLPGWITLTNWQAETADFLGTLYTATIAEPTAVNELVSELVEQAALAIWWDDLAQKIRLQVLRAILTTAATYDDDVILAGALKVSEQPGRRLSRIQTYFGQINPLRPLTDLDNYRSSVETVDADAESDYGSIAQRRVLSRWIPQLGRAVAERFNKKQLGRFRDPPRRVVFELLRGSVPVAPALGGGYQLRSWVLQDETGAQVAVPIQVTKLRPSADKPRVEADEALFLDVDDQTERLIIIDADINNVNLREVHDALYPAPENGDSVTCRIDAGVTVGSVSPSLPAFDVGDWPAGVSIKIILNGRIQGAGGGGGDGGTIGVSPGAPGEDGGPALYLRVATDIEYGAAAELWSGGGGGGGGDVGSLGVGGGGGGGGGGTEPGTVGNDGENTAVQTPGTDGTAEAGGTGTTVVIGNGGGDGGDPGLAGQDSTSALGGAAGPAIDGVSHLTVLSGSADIRGGQIN